LDGYDAIAMADAPTIEPPPVALTIAGSDSSGGAGIQADLKTFALQGIYGASAVTAITAQNTTGVQAAELLDPELVVRQIDAVADDLPIAAVKTGMLGSMEMIQAVAQALQRRGIGPLVVDPVMVAKSGDPLIDDEAVDAMKQQLFPLAAIVTPNRHEAARLVGWAEAPDTINRATEAARIICDRFGPGACVVKAIACDEDEPAQSVDVFCQGSSSQTLTGPLCSAHRTHGSGCTFSAAIAAELARGQSLAKALALAKRFVTRAIHEAPPLGHGTAPVNPLAWLVR
jgi:hydroxymethylpyrimidine/phosphomethylpyrimidine kinase